MSDDTHPELHEQLARYYQSKASHLQALANYHAIKAANPIFPIAIPAAPAWLKEFEQQHFKK